MVYSPLCRKLMLDLVGRPNISLHMNEHRMMKRRKTCEDDQAPKLTEDDLDWVLWSSIGDPAEDVWEQTWPPGTAIRYTDDGPIVGTPKTPGAKGASSHVPTDSSQNTVPNHSPAGSSSDDALPGHRTDENRKRKRLVEVLRSEELDGHDDRLHQGGGPGVDKATDRDAGRSNTA